MIIKTSKAREASFKLLKDMMVEQPNVEGRRWFLWRLTLKNALNHPDAKMQVGVAEASGEPVPDYDCYYSVIQGKTLRGKRFIEIGCKRFVGINRTKLIRWAKGAA